MNVMKRMLVNWRTTSGGLVNLIMGVMNIVKAVMANQDLTEGFLTINIGLIAMGLSLLFARDSAVTSEQSGVTPSHASMEKAVETK
jgi:hypothetical protein